MKRLILCSALFLGMLAVVGVAQPPGGGGGSQKGQKGQKGAGPTREPGGPPKFELGRVLPPQMVEQLKLTKEQEKELAELEKLVKEKLDKLLTDEQKKVLGKGGPPPAEKKDGEPQASAGIQWFTTWESAKAEAARTGRPILLVSAAPHCAGVSGIW